LNLKWSAPETSDKKFDVPKKSQSFDEEFLMIRFLLTLCLLSQALPALAEKYPTPGPNDNSKNEMGSVATPVADCRADNSSGSEAALTIKNLVLWQTTNNQIGAQVETSTATNQKTTFLIFAPMTTYQGDVRAYTYQSSESTQVIQQAKIKTASFAGGSVRVEIALSTNDKKQIASTFTCQMKP
jgi:hypothetical protein